VLNHHTKNVNMMNYNHQNVPLIIRFLVMSIVNQNVYKVNKNVMLLLILLDVKKMVNSFQLINYTYVNQLITTNAYNLNIQYYVQMENADKA
jgi:hypothetical protein